MDKAELVAVTAKEILLTVLKENSGFATGGAAGKQRGLLEILDSYNQIFACVAENINSLTAQTQKTN